MTDAERDLTDRLYDELAAIMRYGELANVDCGSPFMTYGGKKPPSKDVWTFPRHMLPEIEAVLASYRAARSAT